MLTPEQLAERRNYIGASDAAAVLGLSRWDTPLKIWAEKTGRLIPEDIGHKLPVKLGNKLEDTVAELFTEETGKKVQRKNQTVYHPQFPFLAANLDRIVIGEDAGLECKTASGWKKKEWDGEQIPQEYIIQCHHTMACFPRLKKMYIACLIGNEEFVWQEIPRDEEVIKKLVAKEVAFWNDYIATGEMPMILTANDGDTLYDLFPVADPNADVILDDEVNILIEQLEAGSEDVKALGKTLDAKRNELKALLGTAVQGRTNLYRVTWKEQKGSTYTVNREPTRVLRYKKLEEKNA